MTNIRNNSEHRGIVGSQLSQCIRLLQEFAAKLVLEVFGSGGAIWGFSEVCGLRTKHFESIEFWRSAAITTALFFGLRWLRQLQAAVSWLLLQNQKQQVPARTDHEADARINDIHPRTPVNIRPEFTNVMSERSPIGIQLLSLFDGTKDIAEEESLLSPGETCDEFTALTSSPHSPIV